MKRVIVLTAAVVLLALSGMAAAQSSFCTGYQAGFQRGACAGEFGCIPPIPPICPIPNIGQDSYQDGYDRGFQEGQASK